MSPTGSSRLLKGRHRVFCAQGLAPRTDCPRQLTGRGYSWRVTPLWQVTHGTTLCGEAAHRPNQKESWLLFQTCSLLETPSQGVRCWTRHRKEGTCVGLRPVLGARLPGL